MTREEALQKARKQILIKKAKLLSEIGELEAKLNVKKMQLKNLEEEGIEEEFINKILEQEQKRKKRELEKAKKILTDAGEL